MRAQHDWFSADLQGKFPGQQGFSPRNLKSMRAFAEAWPETVIVQPAVAQLGEPRKAKPTIVQAPLAQTDQPVAAIVLRPGAQSSKANLSPGVTLLQRPLPRLSNSLLDTSRDQPRSHRLHRCGRSLPNLWRCCLGGIM